MADSPNILRTLDLLIKEKEAELEALRAMRKHPSAIAAVLAASGLPSSPNGAERVSGDDRVRSALMKTFDRRNSNVRVSDLMTDLADLNVEASEGQVLRLLRESPEFTSGGRGWWGLAAWEKEES